MSRYEAVMLQVLHYDGMLQDTTLGDRKLQPEHAIQMRRMWHVRGVTVPDEGVNKTSR